MELINESGFEAAWIVGCISPPAFSLTAIVKGTFKLGHGKTAAIAEEQLPLTGDEFESGDPSKPLRYPFDFAPFKPRADALLVGTCYSPVDKPIEAVNVRFQIGPLAKSVVVYGDRYWNSDGDVTKPVPFTALPLTLEHAYGGPGFEPNPIGKGFKPIQHQDGTSVYPLPNIESPNNLLRSPQDNVEPTGFGPLPDTWPQRVKKFGTYDKQYLKDRWPWYPNNMDWCFFNTAQEDQQIEAYFQGDEELYFENIHPTITQYRSRLPGLRVRCFLNERVRAHQELREIPMHFDTLWVDMDTETLVLVWRGNIEVRTQRLIEVDHFLVVTEPLDRQPANNEQMGWLLNEALARNEEEDEELEPEDEPEDVDELSEEFASEDEPGTVVLWDTGEPDDTETEVVEDTEDGSPDEIPLTVERVKKMVARRESFADCDLTGLILADLDLSGLDFREAILEDVVLARSNLFGANFTGATLASANLCEAKCNESVFAEADFTEAWMTRVDLSDADLTGADFTNAHLRFAMMQRVNAAEAIFEEADLSDAKLEGANLTAADLCGARLHRTDFTCADLTDAAFENAWGRYVKAPGAIMRKVRGAEALMCEADFRECIADESVWEFAQLYATNFTGASLDGAEFSGAYLGEAIFDSAEVKAARFEETNLRRARMYRCNLLDTSLAQADLTEANLNESNLFGATLMGSVLEKTSFNGANLRRVKSTQEVK